MKTAAVLGLAFCFGGLTSLLLCSIVFGRESEAARSAALTRYMTDMGSCTDSLKSCVGTLRSANDSLRACR